MVSRFEYFEQQRLRRKAIADTEWKDVKSDFLEYLDKTANSSMTFHGISCGTSPVTVRGEYIHRWTERYRKRLLARFYKLDEWFMANPCNVTMMTLTTRHKGSLADQFALLQEHYRKLRNNMRQDHFLGKFPYFYVHEPHQDGYTHIHMLIFQEISLQDQERIKNLWANKYGVGVSDALDFQIRRIDEGLKSPKNYMMKYLTETFKPSDMDFDSSFLLFNAVAWYMGKRDNDYKPIRFWNCSRDLQPILKLDEDDDKSDIDWYKVEMNTPDGDTILWNKKPVFQDIGDLV